MLLDDSAGKGTTQKKLPFGKRDGNEDFVLFEEKDLRENQQNSEGSSADSEEYGNAFINNFKKEAGIEERLPGQKVSNGALKLSGVKDDTFELMRKEREEGKRWWEENKEEWLKGFGDIFAKPESVTTQNQSSRFGNGTESETEERLPGQKVSNEAIRAMGVEPSLLDEIKVEADLKKGKDVFSESVDSGVANLIADTTGGVDFLLDNVLGWEENPVSGLNDKLQAWSEEERMEAMAAAEATGKGKYAEISSNIITFTTQAFPDLVLTWLTGGGSKAASLGSKGTKILNYLKNTAYDLVKSPSFWFNVEKTVYPEYEYALQNGATEKEATLIAPFAALADAQIEIGGGVETLPDVMKNLSTRNNILYQWAKVATSEGNEDITQDVLSEALQKLTFDRDKKWISFDKGENAVFNIPQLIEDWTMGAAIGGTMSAPGMIVGRRNTNVPISAKPFNAYQFQTEEAGNKPISAYAFPAMAQEKNTNKSSVLNLNNGNDNIININMQFFAEKDLETQKSESLKRGIRKLESKIELHKSKLNNPQKYDKKLDVKSEREKAGLKKHWQKEIDNFEKSIENRIEELKKRGDYND